MADLLQFPAQPRSRHARRAYQIHKFAADGSVLTSRTITARNDSDAKQQASEFIVEHRIELWSANRFIAQFGSSDAPIAAWIKSLEDPSSTVL